MHVLEGDAPGHGFGRGLRIFGIAHAVLRLQQIDQPFGRACSALQFAPDFRQGGNRTGDHDGIDHELHERAGCHPACPNVPRADPEHTDHAGENEEDDNNRHRRTGADAPPRRFVGAFGHLGETRPAGGFLRKRLHGLYRAEAFGGIARTGRDPVLIFTADDPEPAAQRKDRHHHRRHDQQHEPRELGRGRHHQRQPADEDQQIAQRDGNG